MDAHSSGPGPAPPVPIRKHEAGFTLTETVVAITLLAMAFVMISTFMTGMLMSTLFARQNQQAASVVAETIERLRNLPVASVAMRSGDLASDPDVQAVGPNYFIDPDRAGPLAAEPIALSGTGAVFPHITTETRNGTKFRLATYVTSVTDPLGSYRRVIARTTWVSRGRTHERQATSFLTETRRGLPLPKFTFATAATEAVNQGTTLVIGGKVVNRGARDSWNLSATAGGGRLWPFSWYVDNNGNGQRDADDLTPLVDTDGDGKVETGLVEPDQTVFFVAVYALPATEPTGQVTVTRTARSMAQPTASTASASLMDSITVQSQSCAGCTLRTFWLGTNMPGNTVATPNLPFRSAVGTQASLPNFDADCNLDTGRTIIKDIAGKDQVDVCKMQSWALQVPNDTVLNGQVRVTVYVAMKGYNPLTRLELEAHLFTQSTGAANGAYLHRGSATTTVDPLGANSFVPVTVTVPLPAGGFTIPQNRRLRLMLTVGAGSGEAAWLAYDTTAHPSTIQLPVVSGL